MRKLLIVFDNAIPKGMVLNALGHMMLGVGPRIAPSAMPMIELYSATQEIVRAFRAKASELNRIMTDAKSIFSDFAHTTTAGSAADHQRQTAETPEAQLCYFASCFCAEDNAISDLSIFLQEAAKMLKPSILLAAAVNNFEFQPPIDYLETDVADDEAYKVSIVLRKGLATYEAFHALVHATLAMASCVDRQALCLNAYPDATSSLHPGMSKYGLVGLKGKKPTRLEDLISDLQVTPKVVAANIAAIDNKSIAVAMFGPCEDMRNLTRKNIEVWNGELAESDFQFQAMTPMAEAVESMGAFIVSDSAQDAVQAATEASVMKKGCCE